MATTLATLLGASPARVALVAALLRHPQGARVSTLATDTGLPAATIRAHLRQLVRGQLVASTLDPEVSARGQRPAYSLDRDQVIEALRLFGAASGLLIVSGEDADLGTMGARLAAVLADLGAIMPNRHP